jgi:hypothetical protein
MLHKAEDVEPWRAGEQRRPDRRRPQHVGPKGELFIPALDDVFGLGARSLVGGTRVKPAFMSRLRPCVPFSMRHGAGWTAQAARFSISLTLRRSDVGGGWALPSSDRVFAGLPDVDLRTRDGLSMVQRR